MDRLKADLCEHGFGMFEGALNPKTTARIRERAARGRAAAERRVGLRHDERLGRAGGRRQPVGGLSAQQGQGLPHPRQQRPGAVETVRFILGANAILSEFSAHVTWPGNREMPLHIDQWFMPHPVDPNEHYPRPSDVSRTVQKCGDPVTARHPINPPVVCNVMFAITDFTVENGATRLVPGSHRSGLHPAPNTDYGVSHAEVPAGSFVVWEGRTWHAASLNTGNSPRVGITTYWTAPYIRQLLNFPYGLRPEVADALSEHERALMGFRTLETYGTSDEFGAQWGSPHRPTHTLSHRCAAARHVHRRRHQRRHRRRPVPTRRRTARRIAVERRRTATRRLRHRPATRRGGARDRYTSAAVERGETLTSPATTKSALLTRLRNWPHEIFACLFLDNRHRILAFEEMFRGTIDGASVHPRRGA